MLSEYLPEVERKNRHIETRHTLMLLFKWWAADKVLDILGKEQYFSNYSELNKGKPC